MEYHTLSFMNGPAEISWKVKDPSNINMHGSMDNKELWLFYTHPSGLQKPKLSLQIILE